MRISLVILVLFKHKFVTIYITKKEKTMKKILALSAILALFTGCTELNLPKPQMSQDSDSEYLDCYKLYPEENDDKDKKNYMKRFGCLNENGAKRSEEMHKSTIKHW